MMELVWKGSWSVYGFDPLTMEEMKDVLFV
jgi:hypothetical protein